MKWHLSNIYCTLTYFKELSVSPWECVMVGIFATQILLFLITLTINNILIAFNCYVHLLKLCLCLSNNILPLNMYVNNAIGAIPCQWGPCFASGSRTMPVGGRTMPVGTLPWKRGPYQDSCGRTKPVGAVPSERNYE